MCRFANCPDFSPTFKAPQQWSKNGIFGGGSALGTESTWMVNEPQQFKIECGVSP